MTERRLVQSIHTREVIPTGLAGDENCYLLAMTGDQIEVLSNLMNYAHRRINWCDEVIDSARYYLPGDADWNDLQALVDDLEYRLMDTCSLQELIDAITALCTCLPSVQQLQPGPLSSGTLQDGLDDGSITYQEPVVDLESDEDACASAQTLWHMVNEYITEVAIPVSTWTFELLMPVAIAYLRSIGVVVEVLLWLGLTIEFVQETISALFDTNGTATVNWMLVAKQELVCAFYNFFKSGSAMDWAVVTDLINAADIPIQVKPFLKAAFRTLRRTAQLFNGTSWALLRIEAGYCDACGQPAGCFDFCDPDWTIDENYAILDPETCTITMTGAVSNYVGAWRALSGFGLASVKIDFDPPDLAPPAFYAAIVRVEDVDHNAQAFYLETSDNTRQEITLDFTLADPVLLEIRTIAGTSTVVYDVCITETP
jgi:hypothetical protein